MSEILINNLTKNKISKKRIFFVFSKFALKYKIKEDVSLAIISDNKMREINKVYRGFDATTDVLSFEDMNEIIISYNQIKRQAKEFKKSFQSEFDFILVHGLLHLIGFKDEKENDRLKMIKLGESFLSSLDD